jgi:hypothetical protein
MNNSLRWSVITAFSRGFAGRAGLAALAFTHIFTSALHSEKEVGRVNSFR